MSGKVSPAAARVKPVLGRDDWIMRLSMLAIGLFLVVAVMLPLYAMLSKSLEDKDGNFLGLANYAEYFATPALFNSIFNSLSIALIATVVVISVASFMPMR